tara:strand:+ start:171 stop:758 length:588 start_codon:yes stop_codon:yes gene_type:complete
MKKIILISALLFSFNGWADTAYDEYQECLERSDNSDGSMTLEEYNAISKECKTMKKLLTDDQLEGDVEIIELDCVIEESDRDMNIDTFYFFIDLKESTADGLIGVVIDPLSERYVNYSRTQFDLFRTTDNSYEFRQNPVKPKKLLMRISHQMRYILNRSTGKLIGKEHTNLNDEWTPRGFSMEANCSKVSGEKLF